MKKVVLILSLILITNQFISSQDGPNSWTVNTGLDARVYAIVINPQSQSTMYFGSLDPGVYKTVNGGLTWGPVNGGMTYAKVQALAISPSNPNVLYAGTDQNGSANSGVYVTTNGGTTWTLASTGITDPLGIQAIVVHPTNPSIAYACAFDGVNASTVGLWKTTNMGVSWTAASTGLTNKNILSILINPLNPNSLYAGSSLVLPGSTGPSKIFKSYDGGNNWAEFSNGLPTGTTTGNPVRALSMSTLDTSVVLAGLFINDTTGGPYVTTNAGQLWQKKYGGMPNATGTLLRNVIIRPGTTNQFFIGLDNSGTGSKGVFRSTDGGVTFTDFSSGALSNTYAIRGMAFKTTGDTTLYVGAANTALPGKGIFEYSWPAPIIIPSGSWTEQTSGLTSVLYSVSAVDDNVAWVCGAAGKVLRTTNKGQTWTNVSGTIPTTLALYNIFGYDANIAVVTGVASTNTSIYVTSNGGATWTAANTHAGFGDDMFMTSATDAYFIGDPAAGNWDLLKSTNGGFNWATWATLPTTNTAGTYNNAFWQQGTQVWFPSVGQSTMLYTSNLGVNWATQTLTLAEITATCFSSPSRGLAGGSSTSPGLLSTTNSGTTWTAITNPYTTLSISGIVGASTTWWVASQGTGISVSTNDGAAFTTAYTAPAGSFYHMTKSRTGATIWAVRSNGGISRYGQPIIGITPISTVTPNAYNLSQNYPNPFNPITKINFAIPKSGLVTMKVYDILGQEISTLVNEQKNAGTYAVDFNAANFSSGTYFYRLESGGFTATKRMILIK